MTFAPQNSLQSFVPTTFIMPSPANEKEFQVVMTDYIKKIVAALNDKDIGQYLQNEVQNGQTFFNPNDTKDTRAVFRKVVSFGELPNNTTKEIKHGISVSEFTRFTRIYGTANDPNNSFIPLPFSSPTLNENIRLEVTDLVVSITTAIDYTAYTDTFVILEYYQT